MIQRLLLLTTLLAASQSPTAPQQPAAEPVEPQTCQVAVYGGTPAGIMAAIAAARQGRTVLLIEPTAHVGGVVSGGLVETDIGRRETVGGLANEFFRRVHDYYVQKYGAESEQTVASRGGIHFEPHVAELIFEQMLAEAKTVRILRRHRIDSTRMTADRIAEVAVEDLEQERLVPIVANVFVDASYEGDLLARVGVPYRVGRESRAEYGESLAGINKGPKEVLGKGDHRTQAYNYRVSLTYRPENRVLFPKPENYTPDVWRSYGNRIHREGIVKFADLFVEFNGKAVPNWKIDTNWCDLTGGSEGYAEGDWETRQRIEARHRDYFLSLLYYLQNDPELPEAFRQDSQSWGLPKDEFVDNGHFPHQIYVREARRMIGRYILTQRDLTQDRYKPHGVCSGSYAIDCHVVQNLWQDGKMVREGYLPGGAVHPYDIPYACLTPLSPKNLLVPICLSASHVAYSSLRMEPVYMMLGEACGAAAHLEIADGAGVQEVDVNKLRDLLRQTGAVLDAAYQPEVAIRISSEHPRAGEKVRLKAVVRDPRDPVAEYAWNFTGDGAEEATGQAVDHQFDVEKIYTVSLAVTDSAGRKRLVTREVPVGIAEATDVTVDDLDAQLTGRWEPYAPQLYTGSYAHRDKILDGEQALGNARFVAKIPRTGRYAVCLGYEAAPHQSGGLKVKLKHLDGVTTSTVDQRESASVFPFKRLGEYQFKAGQLASVQLSSFRSNGRVAFDAVRWIWLGD